MNPFDLPGQQFLFFYTILGIVLFAGTIWLRRSTEPDPAEPVHLTDPYAIAYLRGGSGELMRLATTGLIDRSILQADDTEVKVANPAMGKSIRNRLERAIINHFVEGKKLKEMFTSATIQQECQVYQNSLEELGLLPNANGRNVRILLGIGTVAILWATSYIKIGLALSRHRPFGFLILLTFTFTIVEIIIAKVKRTVRGEHFLQDMRRLFKPLKERSDLFTSHGNTNEALLMAAVFGTVALPEAPYPFVKKLFAKSQGDSGMSCGATCGSSGGSSCSSGSSCGSSCGGGGGCGGCGS